MFPPYLAIGRAVLGNRQNCGLSEIRIGIDRGDWIALNAVFFVA